MMRPSILTISGQNLKGRRLIVSSEQNEQVYLIEKSSFIFFRYLISDLKLEYLGIRPTRKALIKLTLIKVWQYARQNGISNLRNIVIGFSVEVSNLKSGYLKVFIEGDNRDAWISRTAIVNGLHGKLLDHKIEYNFMRFKDRYSAFVWGFNPISQASPKHPRELHNSESLINLEIDQSVYTGQGLEFRTLENAEISQGEFVIAKNRILPLDAFNFRDDSWPSNLVFNQNQEIPFLKNYCSNKVRLHSAVYFGSSESWFHFLVEIFPRYLRADRKSLMGRIPILGPETPIQIVEIMETLLDNSPVVLDGDTHIEIENLLSCTEYRYPNGLSLKNRAEDLRIVRDYFLNLIPTSEQEVNKNVLVVRHGSLFRQIRGLEKLARRLAEEGFRVVDTGQISLADQVKIFRSAEVVIAETGSSLTNMLFCNSRCKIIELNLHDFMPGFFEEFADVLDLHITTIRPGLPRRLLKNLGFKPTVNIKMLENLL
jgi:hypothetical protein